MRTATSFLGGKERQCCLVFFVKDSVNASYLEDSIGLFSFPFWFFRVKCGNEPIRGKARLPKESKLTAIIPNMVLETSKYTFLMISAMI